MPAADPRPGACPVCGLAAGRSPACAECGWTLRTELRLGPVTDRMRDDFDQNLAAARRRFDTRAAAIVSPDRGRLARLIRGGTPDAAEWAVAERAAADAADGATGEEAAAAALATVLRGLATGAEIEIIEIGPAGIGVTRAAMDRVAAPIMREQSADPWSVLLPLLSASEDERLFQLAGGIAGVDRDLLGKSVASVTPRRAPAGTVSQTVVTCQPAGWRILEDVARQVAGGIAGATLVRVASREAAGSGLTGTLRARMPLLRGYDVVVATIEPATGSVMLGTRPLFKPGDVPGAESVLSLRRAPGDRDATTLAVTVAGVAPPAEAAAGPGPGVDGAALDVVSLHEMTLPDEPVYRVRAVLDGPGRVRFTEPRGSTPLRRPWAEVMAAVPGRVDVQAGQVDLVCALELSGDKHQVDRRRDLVRDLLEQLAGENREPGRLRAGLLGCTDHVFAPGEERRRVVRRQQLGDPADALLALSSFRGQEIRYADAAPLEDMLEVASGMLAGSRAEGRSARLLLVAGRRAHPRRLGQDLVQPCPFGCDWQRLGRRLAESGVGVVAVVDAMPGRAARNGFWADIGRAGLRALPDTSAREVGADLGISLRPGQRIGLPLPA